ncbi:hypothetical protein PG996_015710 [Apiospora saccharicola]|uniref:Alb1-domain-containing protein n=1 Tax=Apiospora saccharicola TaxID=335842 RepID=A0ABR1TP67_9PEZI
MAKPKSKAPSKRSREARRATSPGIDTDKSLKNVKAPVSSVDHRPSVLAIHHGAGVSKKSPKSKPLSSKAAKRREEAQDRAMAIMERTQKKVATSKGRARTIQTRRKTWDEINKEVPTDNPFAGLINEDDDDDSDDEADAKVPELDDEMGDVAAANAKAVAPVDETSDMVDDDGIL